MKNKFLLFAALALSVSLAASCKDNEDPLDKDDNEEIPTDNESTSENSVEVDPMTWIAIDGQGNVIDPDKSGYRDADGRKDKQVGIFYFLWHGCHGYDIGTNNNFVTPPTAADRTSPYNMQEILDANPDNPNFPGGGVMLHWGEPYLGYYVMDDEWVIRKHAQMLTDAGVDAIFFDVTNGFHYLTVVKKLCEVYTQMRAEGSKTPQFAFLMNGSTADVMNAVYNEIYKTGKWKDLWYEWLGKPLVLANPNSIQASYKDKFTFRHSWFLWNIPSADTWFGNGEDKWPWGGHYPQQVGMHGGKAEMTYVLPATHANTNIGRSYDALGGGEPAVPDPGKGIFFKQMMDRAMTIDPQMLFFTGWNEWTAQKQYSANGGEGFLGKICKPGDWYFVDQYNHEFSRDLEPLNGDFGDNYYYMLVDYVRKFKGTQKLPTFTETDNISVDGTFDDWKDVKALYADYKGDVTHRNHYGWGRVGTYTNKTGRNDIVLSKVANDGENIYFYAECAKDITSYTGKMWMQLFLAVKGDRETSWEGFDFAVNRKAPGEESAVLEKCVGGWKWSKTA
ncbi:MAG: hypothetical protein HUJ91_07915, partial [Bacteroidales bacterium]|nr:hypothetical protein [Bacteroidales bacterium]